MRINIIFDTIKFSSISFFFRHTLPPPAAPESIRNDIFFTEAAFDKYSVTKAPARKRQRLDSKSDHQAVEEPTKDKKQKTKKCTMH